MKIQSLAIIFIIIIMPITLVLNEYVNNKIKTATTELEYNTRLLNSTYDSIKAYQLNTVNNEFGDVTNSKISDIEAAVSTFYNSLANNFNFTGYKSGVMKEYVPAVAFTLYDGYYIYSPFTNTLTGVKDEDVDTKYSEPGKVTNGLKPYVYYSARYVNSSNGWDFIITYTLDNYITIMGQIGWNGTEPNYVYDCGFLYPVDVDEGIKKNGDVYSFNGVEFRPNDTEELKEFVGDKEYSYARINGKKYYLEENPAEARSDGSVNPNAKFFFINDKGIKSYSQVDAYDPSNPNNGNFKQFYRAIKLNKSAYIYYKRAYEFSSMILKNFTINASNTNFPKYEDKAGSMQSKSYNLANLRSTDAIFYSAIDPDDLKQSGITPLSEYGDFEIFKDNDNTNMIHLANSNFNKHRKSIIRYVIETNMSSAIAGFSSNAVENFIMPKISENDWETIQNDVCEITFLQGLLMGSKKYNGYSVVANMLTKEYIDENDIYILKSDNTYCKANDNTLRDNLNIKSKTTVANYYPGIWKVNFERKKFLNESRNGEEEYYYPVGFKNEIENKVESYLGSYTSIMGSTNLTEIGTTQFPDMYSYINSLPSNSELKRVYYMALGRERWCSYNVNNINYELYNSNDADKYFLKDY